MDRDTARTPGLAALAVLALVAAATVDTAVTDASNGQLGSGTRVVGPIALLLVRPSATRRSVEIETD